MDQNEKWLPVVGFEGLYEVSDHGRVRSLPRPTRVRGGGTRILTSRILKPAIAGNMGGRTGHLMVQLVPREGRHVSVTKGRVHCLVLEAFVGPRPEGFYGCHNDGNHLNNRLENLRWDTPSANNYDRVMHGAHPFASRSRCKRDHLIDGVKYNLDGTFKQRYCKTCKADSSRRSKAKLKLQRAEKAA